MIFFFFKVVLNKSRKAASLFKVYESIDYLIVPCVIKYELEEYLVTSIVSCGKN